MQQQLLGIFSSRHTRVFFLPFFSLPQLVIITCSVKGEQVLLSRNSPGRTIPGQISLRNNNNTIPKKEKMLHCFLYMRRSVCARLQFLFIFFFPLFFFYFLESRVIIIIIITVITEAHWSFSYLCALLPRRSGYFTVEIMSIIRTVVVFFSFSLWGERFQNAPTTYRVL